MKQVLKLSHPIAKEKIWFFAALFLAIAVLSVAGSALGTLISAKISSPVWFFDLAVLAVYYLFYLYVTVLFSVGILKIFLKLADRQAVSWRDLYRHKKYAVNYFIAEVVYKFIIAAGFVLLVFPGIIWAIKFYFYRFLIIDKNMGPLEALRESSRLTKGKKWELGKFFLLTWLLNLLGMLALLVGLFYTVPLTHIAIAQIYRQLSALSKESYAPYA